MAWALAPPFFGKSLVDEPRAHCRLRHSSVVPFLKACVDVSAKYLALVFEVMRGLRLGYYVRQYAGELGTFGRHQFIVVFSCALRGPRRKYRTAPS